MPLNVNDSKTCGSELASESGTSVAVDFNLCVSITSFMLAFDSTAFRAERIVNSLTINNIDSRFYEALKVEADLQGRSIEEQACVILKGALEHTQNIDGLGTRIHERFKDMGGIELNLPVR